jgi:tRNA pseudouridine38-40 synthase
MDDWHYGYGIPFEWDRAWCLPQSHAHPLDLDAMKEAAEYFVGTHDFSSFRGRLCQRHSPIVTMEAVTIEECPPRASFGGSDSGHYYQHQQQQQRQHEQQLVTMTFVANSFLYRQVRNMVGCLVEVGKHGGRLSPKDVRDLVATDWKAASGDDNAAGKEGDAPSPTAPTTETYKHRPYSTAPPQGLFLVDVQHGNFWF